MSGDRDCAPLRLLLVYDTLYPETIGGIEHRAAELARALTARGHAVALAAFTSRTATPPAGVEIVTLGPRALDAGARRGARSALRFAAAMFRLPVARFDVVEAANIPFAHLAPLALACRLAGKPLLVTWHEVWGAHWHRFVARRSLARLLESVEWLGAQLGDAVHAVSGLTARRLESYRRSGPVPILANGIDGTSVRAAAQGIAATGPPMVCAGRLLADKRIDLAIRAAALLADRLPGPLLTVIGEGPEERRLRDLARDLGLADRVVFAGKLPDAAAVWRVAAGARVAVHPSAREGFGIFPLEAMALGLPVVYCPARDSAVPELVRDGTEGIEAAAEPETIAAAALRLLGDESLRRTFADAARRRAADFEWTVVAARFEAECRRLLRT